MKIPRLLWLLVMLLVLNPASAADESKPKPGLNAATFKGLAMRGIGPALMSGRIADVVIHPTDKSTWYVAVGSGNVWKTTNAGTTWDPIFDKQDSYSIGCITLDPNRPDTVWLGTGENVGGRHVGYGDGIYRSLDGGKNWENLGLAESEHIGMIRIDPRDSNVIYVAAQGPLWSAGGDRGLYKSEDGGKTWNKILGGGEYTGVNEVHMDPRDPDVLYASTHQRVRTVAALMNGGPESGIHKSTDGGKTWRELSRGLPEENMGKIGLAISPQRPDVIYATIELERRSGGFWRSEDGGETWEKRNDYVSGATGPHYYQEIFASPHAFDRVYQADVWMRVTNDGGETFDRLEHDHMHPDHHALAFDADDPNYLLVGSDGGLYETWDLGATWKFIANLPVTQFYKVAVDYDTPFYNVYGGTQDNNTQGGPSRTDNTHGIRNSDWFITLGGDGHQPAVDPTNPDIVYSQWQQGNLSRYDRKSGETVYIQPQPEADEPWDRFNWDAPIYISAHDPKRLYFASQRLWRSDDRGDSWKAVSGDLSRGLDRFKLPMMGRVWSWDSPWDTYAMSKFGTITSIAESPLNEKLLYVGTDDGLVQVSEDGGASWRRIGKLPGVPDYFFVNDIKADLHDENTVYVVVDNHKAGDLRPFILKSTNRGRSWRSISGDLGERHLVWRLVQDHVNPSLLFAGTEFGVFFSIDGGRRWIKLDGGAPNIPFRDLAIQKRENDLVGATFGRGFYILDDYTPLRGIRESDLQKEALLFPVKDALWYLPKNPLGRERGDDNRATQGASFFIAPNPPFGAVFTYYLKDEIRSQKDTRREREKQIEKQGGDTPYPGWDALREEALESDPAVLFTVRDAAGNIVRHFEAPVKAGFQRVAWDLRYPSKVAWSKNLDEDDIQSQAGALAPPGEYSVSMASRVDGKISPLAGPVTFRVTPMVEHALPGASPEAMTAFALRLDDMERRVGGGEAAVEAGIERIKAIQETLVRATVDAALITRADDFAKRLKLLQERLEGDDRRNIMNEDGPVSIQRRVSVAFYGTHYSTYGPTPTHKRSLEIAEQQYVVWKRELDAILKDELPAFETQLDAAGVPWTPGRL